MNFKLLIILSVCFLNYFGIGLVYPIFATLLFDNTDPTLPLTALPAYRGMWLGILIALTPLAQFFGAPILGILSDKKGRRCVLLIGTAMSFLGYSLAVLGTMYHSIVILLIYRLVVGLSNGTVSVAQAALADMSTAENKARLFSLLSASAGFGFTIGPFIGGQLGSFAWMGCTGYSGPFIVSGLLCLLNFLLVLLKFSESKELPVQNESRGHYWVKFKQSISQKSMKWLFGAGFMFSFGWAFFNEFIPVLLQKRFAFSMADVGFYYAWGGVGYALSNGLLTRLLLKRISSHRLVVAASAGCSLCILVYGLVADTFLVWATLPPLMFCLALVYPTASALVSEQAGRESQGQILGSYQAVQAFAMGCSPLIFGGAIGALPDLAAWGGALAMALTAIAFAVGCKYFARPIAKKGEL